MYSYTFDEETGGILLNSSPTNFSKEPRPVYAMEMDLLGFNQYWEYEKQNEVPYMWAESTTYWYRGKQIAKTRGGDLFNAPELIPNRNEDGSVCFSKEQGHKLMPIDLKLMCTKNKELLTIIEDSTVKRIIKTYEKYKKKLDIFHVAFSGGKDSAVLLDLVKKALPKGSFVVIFGDTGMEFPDTYKVVDETRKQCEISEVPFYIAKSHFNPEESWKLFGPPARVLRWCCSVHKSTPQTLKMREITGKNNYIGLDFVGVRAHESIARSKYEYESIGKKQKGQYSYNPILEWTSAEIWLYIFLNEITINEAYKKGNSRAGCLFCPMGGGKGDYIQLKSYPQEVNKYLNLIREMNSRNAGDEKALDSYLSNGGWNARKNGRDLTIGQQRCSEETKDGHIYLTIDELKTNWKEWIKTIEPVPFQYNCMETPKGLKIEVDETVSKVYPKEFKMFKQVFYKSAYCVGCKVCEVNCKNGCISFENGLKLVNCSHCGMCHDIPNGCLVYNSIKTGRGEGKMRKGSINSFANHAPKKEWVQEFFDMGNEFWEANGLNQDHQVPMFKKFLRDCGIIDTQNKTTILYDIIRKYGVHSSIVWGIVMSNFAYNPQIRWYIENMDVGIYYDRSKIVELLMADGVSKGDTSSIISAFKRFAELPIGKDLYWCYVEEEGRTISSLCRTKPYMDDNKILLYALYVFAEKCNDYREFHLSYLYEEDNDRDGISPVRIFGLYDEEDLKSRLLGLSAQYPDYINATFTNDLKTITLRDKTSKDVLGLFEEV